MFLLLKYFRRLGRTFFSGEADGTVTAINSSTSMCLVLQLKQLLLILFVKPLVPEPLK